jgi:hypothetical protein
MVATVPADPAVLRAVPARRERAGRRVRRVLVAPVAQLVPVVRLARQVRLAPQARQVQRAPQARPVQRVPQVLVGMARVAHRSTQGRTQRTLPNSYRVGNFFAERRAG